LIHFEERKGFRHRSGKDGKGLYKAGNSFVKLYLLRMSSRRGAGAGDECSR
jgi:hypothetical protein